MKFAAKLSLAALLFLAAGFCLLGLCMTGLSFRRSLQSSAEACAQLQQREKQVFQYTLLTQPLAEGDERYDLYGLVDAARSCASQSEGQLALCYGDGDCLYSRLPVQISRQTLAALVAGGAQQGQPVRLEQGPCLLLALPLELPQQGLYLVSCYSLDAPFAARQSQLRLWLAASLLLLLLGGGLVQLGARALTRPLTQLKAASEQIAAGDHARRTRIQTNDEIGQLSQSFDAMADAVEQQLAALAQNAQKQQDFVAAFTHEIKTPMTSMLGYADLLRARPQSPELQREAAAYIYAQTRRLETLSQKLLTLLRLENAPPPALVPLSDRALFARVQHSLPPAQPVPSLCPGGLWVLGDADLLEDLLLNLVRNSQAACAGRPQGRITVYSRAEGAGVALVVADTGCGIPAEALSRLTEPFYMVDKSRARQNGGSGIGLALCGQIARLHGGALQFESTPGQGTTATLWLPQPQKSPEVTP